MATFAVRDRSAIGVAFLGVGRMARIVGFRRRRGPRVG